MNKTSIAVISGDISQVGADALVTAINSGRCWFGGIDGVIQRVAGNLFHSQADKVSPLEDGQAIVAYGRYYPNKGAFKNVVFVVDDLRQRLREIIYAGLKAASDAGFKTVSIPTIRMGVMLGSVEKSTEEAVNEMRTGVLWFLKNNPDTQISSITFVVYSDEKTRCLLEEALTAEYQ